MKSGVPVHDRGMGHLARLVVLVVAMLGLVSGQPAAAATLSATPSNTEPYRACPVATPGYYECEEIVEPAGYDAARSALGEIRPDEEGTGELGGWSPENLHPRGLTSKQGNSMQPGEPAARRARE
jgi:hypothetical protein